MTVPQKEAEAALLKQRFRGETLTIAQMHGLGVGLSQVQLRAVCQAADELGFGSLDATAGQMTWFVEAAGDPTLFGS